MKCYFCESEDIRGTLNSQSIGHPNYFLFACKKCIDKNHIKEIELSFKELTQ